MKTNSKANTKRSDGQSKTDKSRNIVQGKTSYESMTGILERISDGFVAFDHEMNYTYINRQGGDLLGRKPSALIGKNYWSEYPEAEGTPFANAYVRALETQKPIQLEEYYEPWDRWFENRIYPSKDGLSVFFRDITEYKRTEATLRESEARYRSIFETSGVSIWEEDFSEVKAALDELKSQGVSDFRKYFSEHPDFVLKAVQMLKIIDVNEMTLRLYGAKDKNELLRSFETIQGPTNIETFTDEFISLAEGKTYFEGEVLDQTLQGETLYLWRTIVFPKETAGFKSVLVSLMNITARKRAEEALRQSEKRFRALTENNWDAIALFGADGRILYGSPSTSQVLGYSLDEFVGRNAFELIHKDDQAFVTERLTLSVQQPGAHIDVFARVLHKNGTWRWLEGVFTNLLNEPSVQAIVNNYHDFTERKQAEIALGKAHENLERLVQERTAALSQANTLLQTMLDHVPDHIFFKDLQSRFIRNSRSQAEMLGLSDPAEVVGKSDFDFFPHAQRAYNEEQSIIKSGQPMVDFEEYVVWPDGRETWVSTTKVPLRDEAGQIVGTFGIARDITERKQADEALRKAKDELEVRANERTAELNKTNDQLRLELGERKQAEENLRAAEARYRSLVEQLPIVIYVSPAGDICSTTYISPQINGLLGYTQEEWLNDPKFWSGVLHPQDRSYVLAQFERVDRTGEPPDMEYRMIAKDGSVVWIREQATLLRDSDGHPLLWQGLMIDITDRKQAEENLRAAEARYRSLVEQLPGIVYTNPAGDLNSTVYVSPQVKTFLGYSQAEWLEDSKFWRKLLHPEDRSRVLAEVERVNQSGERLDMEYRMISRDGLIVWFRDQAALLRDVNGNLLLRQGLMIDITDRKQAEEALKSSETRYRLASRATNDVIWDLDMVNDLHTWNENVLSLFGYTADEVASNAKWWHEHIHLADRERVLSGLKAFYESGDTIWADEYRFLRQDDSIAYITDRGYVERDANGKPLRMIGAMSDISARKLAEDQIRRRVDHLKALRIIDMTITASSDLHFSLQTLLKQAISQLQVDAADILLLNSTTHVLEYSVGMGFYTKAVERSSVRIGEGFAGRAALERKMVSIHSLYESSESFTRKLLLDGEDFTGYYGVPLIAKGEVKGVLEVFHRTHLDVDQEWVDFLEAVAGQAGLAIDNATLFQNLQRTNLELGMAYESTLEGWSAALDLRDKETEGHTLRVTNLTLQLAEHMGLKEKDLLHIRRGALLHDIGKMGVPDRILLKPDTLTTEEWEIMKFHPAYAYEMLSRIEYLRPSLDIPYCHHEKWDGTGYPRGLKGEEIPLHARIFAVVDVYDALTSDRPYRSAWTKERTVEYIKSLSGTHFDPRVVNAFLELLHRNG